MFAFKGDSICRYTERVLTSFAEKLLFAISLAVFDNMVTFTYRARSNGSFFGIGGVFDTQLHQDKILDFAKLVIGHSNHHLDKFIKQHHIV
jgi:hypothetical protein